MLPYGGRAASVTHTVPFGSGQLRVDIVPRREWFPAEDPECGTSPCSTRGSTSPTGPGGHPSMPILREQVPGLPPQQASVPCPQSPWGPSCPTRVPQPLDGDGLGNFACVVLNLRRDPAPGRVPSSPAGAGSLALFAGWQQRIGSY